MDEMNPNQSLDTPIWDKELVLSEKVYKFFGQYPVLWNVCHEWRPCPNQLNTDPLVICRSSYRPRNDKFLRALRCAHYLLHIQHYEQ